MQCQKCHNHEANIKLNAVVNGQEMNMALCQNCYNEIMAAQGFGGGIPGQVPQGNLDDFFRSQFGAQQGPAQDYIHTDPEAENGKGGKIGGFLGKFGVNLTEKARKGELDPVIGRSKEVERVIEILNRRSKNNPVLIGEPGVGKTAIVEGLAQKIVNKEVPQKLHGKEVITIDMSSLVQGTGVRGQFEEKIQRLVDEVKKHGNVILFIDEFHQIVGAGSTGGNDSMDAGNILKPALARGEFQLIGATTLTEYRKIEHDAALERRVQPVMVEEPSIEDAIAILNGLQPKYEEYHHVEYTPAAIEAAVKMSDRYVMDRFLPDKAIDLLDEAGSKINLTLKFTDHEVIEERIQEGIKLKNEALESENFEQAAYYRDQVAKLEDQRNNPIEESTPIITEEIIAQIVEQKTNIPVGKLQEQEQNQLLNLEQQLNDKVIGQHEAAQKVTKAIRRKRVGLSRDGRPIGSFMFIGPTGVGKTEMSKQLAEEIFGSKDAMIRFDMSEYMEKHSISKLIGAPAGYVGYEDAGQLTEKVRRNPYSLILLDEIEKAHPDVLHSFLQVLDDGHLTDSQGRKVSFKDTIIIMTSNAGASDEASVGFGAAKDGKTHSVQDKLKNYFAPEFLNRFDAIIEFNSLSKENLLEIVDLMIDKVRVDISHLNLELEVDTKVKTKLVDLGFNPLMGARPMKRVVSEHIEDGIAEGYLTHPQTKKFKAIINEQDEIEVVPVIEIEEPQIMSANAQI
ncbi:MAG: AAA family ATPase [Lactobacillales bacterium]|nr:AAA family ATPase [Lactobacillales bacterium]